jgi:hypothetical protein
VPTLTQSSVGHIELVGFIARLFSAVFPSLAYFSADTSITQGIPIPWDTLGWSALYCLLYCTFALLLALLLFEDRDMA